MGSEPTIFLLACLVSLCLTALIREIAPRFGLTDDPDGHRKLHGRATPVGGGVAVFLTTSVILGTLWLTPGGLPDDDNLAAAPSAASSTEQAEPPAKQPEPAVQETQPPNQQAETTDERPDLAPYVARSSGDLPAKLREGYRQLPTLLLAGLVIVVVGLIDDRKGLRGKHKLLGQAAAAVVLMSGGLVIHRIAILDHVISLGYLAYPFTLCWFLGAINSLNLLDGIDGLATVLGIILSFAIAAMAVVTGNAAVAIIAMVFAGSLLGFLRFNYPPASIFLGDSGSMLIGLVVGALAIGGSLKGPGTVLLAAPLAIWTIPFFDSIAAILRRKLTGRSVYDTDRGHLHHRMLALLGSNRKVLGWIAACCAVLTVAILVGLVRKNDYIVLLTCIGIVAIFVATGAFGRAELFLVGARLRGFSRGLMSPLFPRRGAAWQTTLRLQGNRQWDLLWNTFIESADKLDLLRIRLDLNLPTMHEAYHASWERSAASRSDYRWHVEIPLMQHLRPMGLIRVTGRCGKGSPCAQMQQLLDLIEPFEASLRAIAADEASAITSNQPAGDAAEPSPTESPPAQSSRADVAPHPAPAAPR